jgi:hypothetical protein
MDKVQSFDPAWSHGHMYRAGGGKIRILCTDKEGSLPIVALADNKTIISRRADGKVAPYADHGWDIVNAPPPKKVFKYAVAVWRYPDRPYGSAPMSTTYVEGYQGRGYDPKYWAKGGEIHRNCPGIEVLSFTQHEVEYDV